MRPAERRRPLDRQHVIGTGLLEDAGNELLRLVR
jgi:hypothetical protein